MIEQIKLQGFDGVVEAYDVRLPTSIHISKRVRKAVNLNVYRNLHFQSLGKQKSNFEDSVIPLLKGIPKMHKVWIHYTIYGANSGKLDTMNVGSILDKYFSDTLVKAGKLEDDNYNHIVLSTFSFGGVSSLDGYAIARIHVLQKEPKNMRVLLDQEDIQKALDDYLKTLGIAGATGIELGFEHGEVIAEVMMGDAKPKNRGGRPKGSRNKTKPKETENDDDADTSDDSDSDDTAEDTGSGTDSGSGESASESDSTGEAKPVAKTSKGGGKGNLFGDEESQSSETNEGSDDQEGEAEDVVKPKTKKSSIFDA